MVCQTVKTGVECVFMSKNGCTFNGGSCHVIIDKCEGCNKMIQVGGNGKFCMIYPDPSSKWTVGNCPTASHVKKTTEEKVQKINPLKASKRNAGK